MELVRMICANLKRAVFRISFIIIVIFMGILLYLDVYNLCSPNSTIVELMSSSGLTMFSITTFAIVTMTYSRVLCEDRESRMLTNIIARSSSVKYSISIVVACGIVAFIAVLASEILVALAYSTKIDFMNEETVNMYMSYEEKSSLISEGHYMLYFLCTIILKAFRGSFFAMFALTMSSVVKNKMLVISSPVILFYFLMRFGYGELELPPTLNIRGVYFIFVLGEQKEILSTIYTLAYTVVVGVVATLIIEYRIRRDRI